MTVNHLIELLVERWAAEQIAQDYPGITVAEWHQMIENLPDDSGLRARITDSAYAEALNQAKRNFNVSLQRGVLTNYCNSPPAALVAPNRS